MIKEAFKYVYLVETVFSYEAGSFLGIFHDEAGAIACVMAYDDLVAGEQFSERLDGHGELYDSDDEKKGIVQRIEFYQKSAYNKKGKIDRSNDRVLILKCEVK